MPFSFLGKAFFIGEIMAGSYRAAVAWIAENDDAGSDDALNPEVVAGYVTTILVADVWDKEPEEVAAAIVKYRKKNVPS
jgi:hypothetical protein